MNITPFEESELLRLQEESNELAHYEHHQKLVREFIVKLTSCINIINETNLVIMELQDKHWIEVIQNITQEILDSYEFKKQIHDQNNIEEKHTQLLDSRNKLLRIEGELKNIRKELENIPEEARCPIEELISQKQQLLRDQVDVEGLYRESNSKLSRRLEDKTKYEAWILEREEISPQVRIYSRLRYFLSDTGLQLELIRHAERTIVQLANETLTSLSNRNLYLELRDTKTTTDALDILVIDKSKGNNKVDIVYASGSQQFRVSISLALAISQFVGGKSRYFESVIIDEGFGSLDKAGRTAAIQELERLSEQSTLKRIILVSHQEEFFQAFRNGYFIQIKNHSSTIESILR